VAVFGNDLAADEVLHELWRAKIERQTDYESAASLRRDRDGKLHTSEVGTAAHGEASSLGGVLGAVIGLLAGPAGVLFGSAAGVALGDATLHALDFDIPTQRLRELGAPLEPNTSAIVVVAPHEWSDDLRRRLVAAGAQVHTEALPQT
jgi:uncharacterized membrane protein